MKKKIRVLVVDDSRVFREVLTNGISSDPDIEVVATAKDAFDARNKIVIYKPNVIICDVVMPKMSGIEFVQKLIPQYPIPVIIVTSISKSVFDAIKAGAVDFITKPDFRYSTSAEDFIIELISKIKTASNAKVSPWKSERFFKKKNIIHNDTSDRIIALGASTGGTQAINYVLSQLPDTIPGFVVVQHIPPVFSSMFAERLNNTTPLKVKEAQTGDYIEKGHVFIAPGDKHMKIKKVGEKYKIYCFEGERVSGHCPSVDVLFQSVAEEAGDKAIGVILTGMGSDGAKGMLSMRRKGARTIGQDEESCVVYGMPKVAFNMGAVEKQVPLKDIPQEILSILTEK
ncbi:MAG: protein-glutamate methylesterase/protein-glutamine glutaminase [Tepidanaerobacteraceae bacterium]|nr:chemotaxis response regulator protein-glutamate methylesterase [Thermoanaerobacterales bacterium]